nr:MAG TPA: hypothetical protein [Caudoviricetes sp.]
MVPSQCRHFSRFFVPNHDIITSLGQMRHDLTTHIANTDKCYFHGCFPFNLRLSSQQNY